MKTTSNEYHGHRFPSEVINHGAWLYCRFSLSLLDVEERFANRGITVTHETIPACADWAGHWAGKSRQIPACFAGETADRASYQ